MLNRKIFFYVAISLFIIAMINGCKKADWRDNYIGSFDGTMSHEKRITNYLTGTAYYYLTDTILDTKVNISITKNGFTDQLTIKVKNNYFCDVDKDGYTGKSNIEAVFALDSVKLYEYVKSDTIFYGRNTYVAKRN
jgi:hypothetical protein